MVTSHPGASLRDGRAQRHDVPMPIAGAPRTRPLFGAAVGLIGVVLLKGAFVIFDPHVTRAVPLLLLLVPVTMASVIGGAPLQSCAATSYAILLLAMHCWTWWSMSRTDSIASSATC